MWSQCEWRNMRVVVSVLFAGVLGLCLRYDVASATCEESNVHVWVVAGDKQIFIDHKRKVKIDYRDKITIFCTGSDSKKLKMRVKSFNTGDVTLASKIVNKTTREFIMENPMIHFYYGICTDVGTMCEEKFSMAVFPAATVMSPSVRLIGGTGDIAIPGYFVPAGEDYEVVCAGNPPLYIMLIAVNSQILIDNLQIQTISLNKTTIKSIKLNKAETDHQVFQYACQYRMWGVPIESLLAVIINHDYPPVLNEFWCIEMDSQIDCTWQVVGTKATSTLLYKDKNGNTMLLDAYKIKSSDNYYGTWRCEWSLENVKHDGLEYQNDIILVLQACRLIYCANQTYHIDRTSIMKSASPVGLGVVETEPNRAVIMWNYNEGYPVKYNVTYRIPGLEWAQELKASSQENCAGGDCKMEIKLPCAGVLYELKMYVKSTTAPHETAYWSDPATLTFHAGFQDSADAVDPMCNEKPESIVNKYVGAQKAKEFKRSFMNDGKALFGKIQSMKRKIDLIKELCREQSVGDCEHRSDYVLSAVKMP